jgi:O-antigen/teichoic acid export membrane protein
VGRALQYVLLWAAARSLGSAAFGDYSFALSTGLMLAQVADFGLQLFVQRELARRISTEYRVSSTDYQHTQATGVLGTRYSVLGTDTEAGRLVGGGLVIKGLLSVVAMGMLAGLVALVPVGNKGALLLVGLSMVLATGLDYLSYCFRAMSMLRYEALGTILARFVNLALGLGLLALGAGIWGLALAGNLAMVVAIGFLYTRLLRYVRPVWRPDRAYWRRTLAQPTAIGIGVIFSIISFRVDNLLIPPIAGREALGLYNVAYKLFEPALILPATLLAATFPLIAQAVGNVADAVPRERDPLPGLLGRNLLLLFGMGSAVAVLMWALGGPVLGLLYGAPYAGSAPVLQILAFACVPMYLNYALTHTLIAADRPRLFALFTLAALFANVAANLVLIPALGIRGAALATVCAEVVLLALCSVALYGLLRGRSLVSVPVAERRAEDRV